MRLALNAVLLFHLILAAAFADPGIEPTESAAPAASESDSLSHWRAALANPNEPLSVVFLGDSNTEVNWTTGPFHNYAGLVAAGIAEGGGIERLRVVRAGRSAATAEEALASLSADALVQEPDLVVISFGTNEAWKYPEEPARLEAALDRMIGALRELDPAPSILLRTPAPNFDKSTGSFAADSALDRMAEAIRATAARHSITLVDHHRLWHEGALAQPIPHYYYNNLHPNEHGHRQFYGELAPVLGLPAALRWEKTN